MSVSMKAACDRCGDEELAVASRISMATKPLEMFRDGCKVEVLRFDGTSEQSDLCKNCTRLLDLFMAFGTPEGRAKIGVPKHFELLIGMIQKVDEATSRDGGEIGAAVREALVKGLQGDGG